MYLDVLLEGLRTGIPHLAKHNRQALFGAEFVARLLTAADDVRQSSRALRASASR
jgi:hypothetical protein